MTVGPALPWRRTARTRIFIAYRRTHEGWADNLWRALCPVYGKQAVFKDNHSISPGLEWLKTIRHALSSAEAVLVLVGPEGLLMSEQGADPALESERDVLREEIRMALKRGIPLIPVLLPGAEMPYAEHLPSDVQEVAARQAVAVHSGDDTAAVVAKVGLAVKPPRPYRLQVLRFSVLLALLAVGLSGLVLALRPEPLDPPVGPTQPAGNCTGRPVEIVPYVRDGTQLAASWIHVENAEKGIKCVELKKSGDAQSYYGTKTYLSLRLCPEGGECVIDQDYYAKEAGPARVTAPNRCIRVVAYGLDHSRRRVLFDADSGLQHCD